ncbi:class I SAM-dependent methyltransferase [Mycobacterium haemophilum]
MTSELMDWEATYREQGAFEGPPPWNIGEPQPEFATLIRSGKVRSDVLDAGCGAAELSLALAAQGHTVVGIDLAAAAIGEAQRAAKDRGLKTATFVQDDIRSFTGYDGRFNTIIDSTLFHSLPVEARDDYLRCVHRAAAPGAAYYALVLDTALFPPGTELPDDLAVPVPHLVTEDELRQAVSQYWEIDEIRPAYMHVHLAEVWRQVPGFSPDNYECDEKGRLKVPAFMLTAHKAG